MTARLRPSMAVDGLRIRVPPRGGSTIGGYSQKAADAAIGQGLASYGT
ncbi:hypothetical protein [Natronospirillum operosum]|nr:hypothetical protein [Natronospirillum operosum]